MYLPGYKRKPTLLCSSSLLKSLIYFPWNFPTTLRAPAGISAPLKSFLLSLVKLSLASTMDHSSGESLPSVSHPSEPPGPSSWIPTAVLYRLAVLAYVHTVLLWTTEDCREHKCVSRMGDYIKSMRMPTIQRRKNNTGTFEAHFMSSPTPCRSFPPSRGTHFPILLVC